MPGDGGKICDENCLIELDFLVVSPELAATSCSHPSCDVFYVRLTSGLFMDVKFTVGRGFTMLDAETFVCFMPLKIHLSSCPRCLPRTT